MFNFSLNEKFFSSIFYNFFLTDIFFFKFINGFLLKKTCLYFFFTSFLLHFFVIFFKNSLILKITALMDVFGVDLSLRISNLFEINYCFLNHIFSFRFFFKIHLSSFLPAPSISSYFPSSN